MVLLFVSLISFSIYIIIYPLPLEITESSIWLQILIMKSNINPYNLENGVFITQSHGLIDFEIKKILSQLFNFKLYNLIRLPNLLIFLVLLLQIIKKNKIIYTSYYYIFFCFFIILYCKNFQSRSDFTASLFFLMSLFFINKKDDAIVNLNSVLFIFLNCLTVLCNYKFIYLSTSIYLLKILCLEKNDVRKISLKIILPVIIFLFFFLMIISYKNITLSELYFYHFEIFGFEKNNFSEFVEELKVSGLKIIILFSIYIIIFINLLKIKKFNNLAKSLYIFVFLLSFFTYYLNYKGGGIYYFLPVILYMYSNLYIFDLYIVLKEKKNLILPIIFIFFSIFTLKYIYTNYYFLLSDYKSIKLINKFLNDNYLDIYSTNIHHYKKKFSYETFDRFDLSYNTLVTNKEKQKIINNHRMITGPRSIDISNQFKKYKYLLLTKHDLFLKKKITNYYDLIKKYDSRTSNIFPIYIFERKY